MRNKLPPMKWHSHSLASYALSLVAIVSMAGCSSSGASPQRVTEACGELTKTATDQETAFVTQVQTIRNQHIEVLEYDRQMIAALTERRAALQSTLLTDSDTGEGVSGCSGAQLDDLRRQGQQEMARLEDFLKTFRRALQADPAGVYIDAH